MKRKFFTNLVLLIALNLLIKPFWIIGIDIQVQNVVGDENYGLYFVLFNFSLILNIVLDLGITNYNNRNIAQHHYLLPKHLSNILGLKIILGVVYAIICFGIAALIGYDNVQFGMLMFLVFNQFLALLILYLRSNISALHLFRTDSILSVLDRLIMIVLCSVFLFTNITNGVFKIEWFVYIQTISYFLTLAIVIGVVISKSGWFSIRFNPRFSMAYLKKTYPYALLTLLMAFYNRIDAVLLERLLPADEGRLMAGIYAHSFRLLDAASMFGLLFSGMLLPIFARMLKKKQDVGEMTKFSFSLIIVLSVTVSVVAVFFGEEVISLLYPEHSALSPQIFSVLMCSFIPISITYIFGTLLTANGSMRQLNTMAAFGVLINIGLNLLLIPEFKALGAAYVSLITQSITAIIQIVIAFKVIRFKVDYNLVGRVMLFLTIALTFGFISTQIDEKLIGFLLLIIGSVLGAFAVKLIHFKSLIQLILSDQD